MGRPTKLLLALLVFGLVLAACGGGGDDAEPSADQPATNDDGGDGDDGSGTDPNVMSSSFSVGDLPSDFRSDLAPDSFSAGMYAELGTVRNANFEVDGSFDDLVADYTAKLGEPILVGDDGERLAQWTVDDKWSVSIIEDDPLLVGISTSD